MQPCEVWLEEKQVAKITGLSTSTLQKHRFQRRGIPYSKVGRSVRYAKSDVEAFMVSNLINFSYNLRRN